MVLVCLMQATMIDGRGGKKKKKKVAGGGAADPCWDYYELDCSDTCCKVDRCADGIDECQAYYKRPFLELYVGFGILIGTMIAIPFFIKIMNCLVLFKFCQTYDEMSETHFGGYSICDCFAVCCFCCCYKRQAYEKEEKLAKIKAKE